MYFGKPENTFLKFKVRHASNRAALTEKKTLKKGSINYGHDARLTISNNAAADAAEGMD